MNKPVKTLYFDVETTGKNPEHCAIVQIAGIIEIDKEVVDTFNFTVRPHSAAIIETEALEVIGKSAEEIAAFDSIPSTYNKLFRLFDKYIDKYDKTDKFYPAGYNVRFDLDFLQQFVKRVQRAYNQQEYGIGSYIRWQYIDVMQIAYNLNYMGKLSPSDFKLGTLAELFQIDIQAHDALSDVRTTREIYYKLIQELTHEK